MEDGRHSATALTAAALRAHHYLFNVAPRVLDDGFAMRLAGMTSPGEVGTFVDGMVEHFARLGARGAAEAYVQDITLSVCARSRIAEDRLAASSGRMKQLVILGAGLDSTAYRRKDLTAEMQVFEVDHPATQAWKRDKLTSLRIAVPDNLRFVPFDFEHQTIAEALAAGGIRRDRLTFFTWMGVQPYLSDDAVMITLDAIAGFASGSELAMDLMTPPDARQLQSMTEGTRRMIDAVAEQGEPFRSAYSPDVFEARLRERGFTDIDIVVFHDWFIRNGARFQGRFSPGVGPCAQVRAIVC